MKYKDIPMKVPCFPIHTQSTEMAVKDVSIASATVFGHEKRDGYVRARMSHREILPTFESKKGYFRQIYGV